MGMKSQPSIDCSSDSGAYPHTSINLFQRSTNWSRRLVSTAFIMDSKILNSQVLHSGDFLACCVFGHDCPEQILLGFFLNPMEKALKCRSPSLTMERLALLNQRYIAIGAGRNWYNFWTDLEDSKAPRGINHRRPEPAGWRVPGV